MVALAHEGSHVFVRRTLKALSPDGTLTYAR